ncbi:15978_t:CDS:2, partial [Dentiscutata heterogama]
IVSESIDFHDSQCISINDIDDDHLLEAVHIVYASIENLLCIIFQIFQMYFGFNVLFHEQTFQLIAIVVFDFGWALYGIGQAFIIKYFRDQIEKIPSCRQIPQYDLTFRYFDIPYTVVYFTLALISTFVSFKLYQQFGWNIYKKIGADVEFKKLYTKRLVFVTLLKYELYFCSLFLILNGLRLILHENRVYWNYHTVERVLGFFMALLAYQSIRLEWKIGMYIFFVLWVTYILDSFLVAMPAPGFIAEFFLQAFFYQATIVFGSLLVKGFGKGLKKFFVKSSAKLTSPSQEEANTERRIPIDD